MLAGVSIFVHNVTRGKNYLLELSWLVLFCCLPFMKFDICPCVFLLLDISFRQRIAQ